jgi:uncharacterized membrane protein YczE
MKSENLLQRCFLLIIGLIIMAYGVALSIRAGLGTSPISSLPYALSRLTPLTVGTATIAMHCVLILLQIILLRKNYKPIQLLQLPVALLFGWLTDATLWTVQFLTPQGYIQRWICCLLGIFLVAIGVSFEVNADVVPLAGEGFSMAVSKTFSFPFANVKIGFDCSLVAISCILGLIGMGKLLGVREGTAAAAVLVGLLSKQVTKRATRPLINHLCPAFSHFSYK